jgi:hypothetical protein
MKVKNNTEKRFKDLNLRISWQDRRIYVSINDKNKKIKYRAENPNEKSLICYKIDDSNRINKDAMRCDSGLYIDELSTSNRDRLILIEFKGSNVNEAIEQIKSTVKDLIITPKITIDKLDACIVLKKIPILNIGPQI